MTMSKTQRRLSLALVIMAAGAGFAAAEATAPLAPPPLAPKKMSFFITSVGPGNGGDLGGLKGADAWCQSLAAKAGASGKTWHAYLSATAQGAQPAVNARDRIGKGPWFNARGVQVASSVDDLHSAANLLGKQTSLSELGNPINGRGDTPNTHDMMTGSTADGRLAPPAAPPLPANAPAGTAAPTASENLTCNNWTSSGPNRTMLGHHDRQGGGQDPTSWNAAHQSRSCAQADLVATGGNGLFYCFAAK